MPDYVLLANLEADLPPQFLIEALDDDSDGVIEATTWNKVAAAVAAEIDGLLGQRYTVPFQNPLPAIIPHAARILALHKLYQRRGVEDKANPFAKSAEDIRAKLSAIGSGKESLTPGIEQASQAVSIIAAPSKLHSPTGKNST